MKTCSGDQEYLAGVIRGLLAAATLVMAPPVFGHHSPIAFDLASIVVVQGTVNRYDWRNPHVYIYVDVDDDSGERIEWLVEGDPTPLMTRSGWTSSTLEPGDRVSFELHPERNSQRNHGLLVSLTQTDGTTLGRRTGGPAPRATAGDISGVWDGQENFQKIVFLPREYTEAGLIAHAEYTPADYPPGDCIPFATPHVSFLPYLSEIEILGDKVLIRNEFYGVERTIYTDGRDHPLNAARTNQGHSIGHWEGDALIVDTTLFANHRIANGRASGTAEFEDEAVPSGAQKHTIEKFELSDDRSQMNVEIFVEDPEFLVEPFVVNTIWDYTPSRELDPFDCDPENARIFELQ